VNAPTLTDADRTRLLRRGFALEYATLLWNVIGVVILAITAIAARSVALVMFALAYSKTRTGTALGNPVLRTEGHVTLIDGILAAAVLTGLVLNATLGWWQADPAAGYVLVYYAVREARAILTGHHSASAA
jgi:divalent metal cation (Fe/Co/Zn/Cd) transporter